MKKREKKQSCQEVSIHDFYCFSRCEDYRKRKVIEVEEMEADPLAMETAQRRLRIVNAHLQTKTPSGIRSTLFNLGY